MSLFKKAQKSKTRARIAIIGPSGSGKSYTALTIAKALGKKIAVIDTERGSASKYAGDVADFDVCELADFAPKTYIAAMRDAAAAGYDVIVIDSLSHAWMGKGGILEQKDKSGSGFDGWRKLTPLHNEFVEAILSYPGHVVATLRVKTEYVIEKDANGKSVPRKVGLAPVQRDGIEFEFDIVADMDADNTWRTSKSRCPAINGAVIAQPGAELGEMIKVWLDDGAPPAPKLAAAPTPNLDPAPEPKPDQKIGEALAKSIARYPHANAELHKIVESGGVDVLGKLREACKRLGLAEQQAKLPARTPDEAATVQRLRDTIAQLDTDGLTEAAAQAREIVSEYGGLDGCTGADLPALVSQVDALATSVRTGRAA